MGLPEYASHDAFAYYAMWTVWQVKLGRLGADRLAPAAEASAFMTNLSRHGVVGRGIYDLAGMRAGADYMTWWHAASAEALQTAQARLRRTTALGRASVPVWSQVAAHRPAEFDRSHLPAFLAGEAPRRYACVYPSRRSVDWFLLSEAERQQMLAEHDLVTRGYPDVRTTTLQAFALSDYEWIIAFEADELHRLVELLRRLRSTSIRRHVRGESPLYTGPRVQIDHVVTSAA
ncbi:hydrogen peroxide-dependent heme synthase [Pseudonocardia sp.]|jgi:peroxiredoxin|uniref:hydrogen peroxide-dependent heme synthase n=1 Tax=Pseudonocardia sp. TaxID=60912 RepID=UPI0031FC2F11